MLSSKTFLQLAGIIFSIVGALHVLRLLLGFGVVLAGWDVPMWVSILGVLLAGYLAYNAFTLAKKKSSKK